MHSTPTFPAPGAPTVRTTITPRPPRVAAAIIAAAGLAAPALGVNMQWTGAASNSWADPGNWTPFGVPSNLTDVFIGPHPAVENDYVDLTSHLTIGSLTMTDGMRLRTDFRRLTVDGDTLLTGANSVELDEYSSVLYRSGLWLGAADGYSLDTHDLRLEDQANIYMTSSFVRVRGDMTLATLCSVYGSGVFDFTGASTTFHNDGVIQVASPNGIHMRQFGGGLYDLDGYLGDGHIHVGSYDTDLHEGFKFRVDGTGLSDSFSGRFTLGPDADVFMNLSDGWTADANSRFTIAGFPDTSTEDAVIRGAEWTMGGWAQVVGHGGLRVESDAFTLLPSTEFTLGTQTRAILGKNSSTPITVEGGTYALNTGALMEFRGDTLLKGGDFSTTTQTPDGGNVLFTGHTEIDGNATFNGFARFEGDVTVAHPSVITGDRVDLDGLTPNTWNISNSLVIHADHLNQGTLPVASTMNISGGFLGALTVDLGAPGASWKMAGDLNLTGDNTLFTTRLAGAGMNLSGDMTIDKRVQITASLILEDSSTTTFATPASILRTRGQTVIESGAQFVGSGTLRNGEGGILALNSGASLDDVALVNDGNLYVSIAAGVGAVREFTNTAAGEWIVDIIADASGFENDLLLVTGGGASLAGLLNVHYSSLGGVFLPEIGDEFTILASLGAVNGTFDTLNAVSFLPGGVSLEWTAIYRDHSVALRLDNIVPTPGALALLGCTGLLVTRRVRTR